MRATVRTLLFPLLSCLVLAACDGDGAIAPPPDAGVGLDAVAGPELAGEPDLVATADQLVAPDLAAEVSEPPPRFPACDESATEQTITFVHVNDIHSTYTPDTPDGSSDPVARIRGYYERVLLDNPYTLFTNGGDDHEKGSVAEPLSEGWATERIIKAMRFDARVIGNHDFAWSEEEWLAHTRDERALVLATNTRYEGPSPELYGAVDFGVIEVGCLRVGFFGMVSKPWDSRNEQYDGDFFPGSDIHTTYDYEVMAAEMVAAHGDDVDLMVMLSHLGVGADRRIAENVAGIDVILGGHSHTPIPEPESRGQSVIVQSGSNCTFITRLDLEVEFATGRHQVTHHAMDLNLPLVVPTDPELHAFVEQVMAEYAPDARQDVAWVSAPCAEPCVARTLALATLDLFPEVDAVAADQDLEWGTWFTGGLTPQDLLDTYKIERQPAGSPGYNAMYSVEVTGEDLLRVAQSDNPRWTYVGLAALDIVPENTYRLGIQKRGALNPDIDAYAPVPGLTFLDPQPLGEAFAILLDYGRARSAQGMHLDADLPL